MNKKNEPAFPIQTVDPYNDPDKPHYGITKREYFAAMAMQGLIKEWPEVGGMDKTSIVKRSYEMADAMLSASEADHD